MGEVLAYQPTEMQIHRDPDGTVQIVIPPMGWRKALGVKSSGALAFLIFFVAAGLALPPVLLFFFDKGPERIGLLIACPILECIGLGVVWFAFDWKSRASCLIRVTPDELRIEQFGLFEPRRFTVSREEIALLAAQPPRNADVGEQTLYLHVRRNRYDMADSFLGYLPRDQVQKVAAIIRETLGFQRGDRDDK